MTRWLCRLFGTHRWATVWRSEPDSSTMPMMVCTRCRTEGWEVRAA